jgi:tRNA dimethylallyltransferase
LLAQAHDQYFLFKYFQTNPNTMIQNKIISIIGPTAVGKTSFALKLIDFLEEKDILEYTGFDIISADSRQVYKNLKIISGADIPPDFNKKDDCFKKVSHSQKKETRIYGIGMLEYQDEWSVAHFREFAQDIIKKSHAAGRLPIIVGGTGLYHEHLFNPSPILNIAPNQELRNELSGLEVVELQEKLCQLDQEKFEKMNKSDKNNPVRLIRALEIATFNQKMNRDNGQKRPENLQESAQNQLSQPDQLTIGLKDDLENISQKIAKRVAKRFENGAKPEVEKIKFLVEEFGVNKQLVSATGVREIGAYLDGFAEAEKCQEKWALREFQYAKRQLTWWKKRPNVKWFEVGQADWKIEAKELVNSWLAK